VTDHAAFALRLAVEEVCLNLMHYGYADGRSGPITVEFQFDDGAVTLTVIDRAPPFPPDAAPEPQVDADVTTRSVGGLGWHLVKRMIDEISYCSDPRGGNRLTLVKRDAASHKDK
jgi:anti-sigma regulatory factor (Ser/Thr protein kinase)